MSEQKLQNSGWYSGIVLSGSTLLLLRDDLPEWQRIWRRSNTEEKRYLNVRGVIVR